MSGNLGGRFDASTVEPRTAFTPLPAGDYRMQIINSEVKDTKAGNGSYLELEMEVLDGEYAGRKYWDRLNLWNPNEKAVDIAWRTMSAICRAAGKLQVDDSSELHFLPFMARMKLTPRKDTGELQNEVSYLTGAEAAPAPQRPVVTTQQFAAAAASGGVPQGVSVRPAPTAPRPAPTPSTAGSVPAWRQKKAG